MPAKRSGPVSGKTLTIWTPEDREFWVREGQAIASLNLRISIPALFRAFAIGGIARDAMPKCLAEDSEEQQWPR